MGHLDRLSPTRPNRRMTVDDLAALGILGIVARTPLPLDEIGLALDDLVGHLWFPPSERIVATVLALTEAGALSARPGPGRAPDDPVFTITAAGRDTLAHLSVLPTAPPACCTLGSVAQILKALALARLLIR
jgi:hypothetical protein